MDFHIPKNSKFWNTMAISSNLFQISLCSIILPENINMVLCTFFRETKKVYYHLLQFTYLWWNQCQSQQIVKQRTYWKIFCGNFTKKSLKIDQTWSFYNNNKKFVRDHPYMTSPIFGDFFIPSSPFSPILLNRHME